MVLSHVPALPLVLLSLLVGINGVATGCLLSLGRVQKAPRVVAQAEAVESASKPRAKAKRAPRKRVAAVVAPEVVEAAPAPANDAAWN